MLPKRMLLSLGLVLLVLCAWAPFAIAEGNGDAVYRAILIGNENYSGTTLEGPIVDVNRMQNALQAANEAGARYQSLTPRTNLKTSEITSLISDMQSVGVDGDDVTLLYYAGLGSVNDAGAASLVGRDGTPLPLADLRVTLDRLPGTKVIVLDARYLESQAQKSKLSANELVAAFNQGAADAFRGGTTQQRYQLLSSCTMLESNRAAAQAIGTVCGAFTYNLVMGCGYDYAAERAGDLLADANQNGAVSLIEARDYALRSLSSLSAAQNLSLVNDVVIYPADGSYPLFSKRATTEILSITLDRDALSVAAGKTDALNASVMPINARQRSVSWVSSDLAIVTVDREGTIRGIRPGQAVVTAMAPNGMSASCKILVRDVIFAESVAINASKLVVGSGQEQVLSLDIVPGNSNEIITWKSADPSVAMVSDTGVVNTLRNGSTVITATTESGMEVSCVVQVVNPDSVVSEVSIDAKSLSLFEGEARLLNGKVKPARASDPMIVWTSSDEKVAQVESNGLVAGVGNGKATITATASSGVSASIEVNVKGATVVFNRKELTLKKGKKTMLKWTIQPKGALMDVEWASSNPAVATVTDKGGVEAIANGETAISATLPNGMKAICRVSVASVTVKEVKLSKAKLSMGVGEQRELTGSVQPQNATIKSIYWNSSNEEIATVDENGNITALGVGKVNIVGRAHNGTKARCVVTVKPAQVNTIELSETEVSLMLGEDEPLQLSAIIEPQPTVGNNALKWSSSNKKVATVNQEGLVTPRGSGTAVIVASSGKVKANCKVTVSANRTLRKKPAVGKGRQVYTSLRQVSYADDHLVVQMYFVNRTKKAARIPGAGMLTLTLGSSDRYELMQVEPNADKKLNAGKTTVLTYKISLADNENLKGLDLRGANVQIVASDAPESTQAPEAPQAESV